MGGRNTQTLLQEIAKAKKRFGLPDDAPVFSCYEAGRDGFWLHRFLESQGVANQVVDSSSIEVKRQGRRKEKRCQDPFFKKGSRHLFSSRR